MIIRCLLLLVLLLPAACSFPRVSGLMGGATTTERVGVIDNTLTANTMPPISITANAPLRHYANGYLEMYPPSEANLNRRGVKTNVYYAIFGDGQSTGPVTVHAHAVLGRIEESEAWVFEPDPIFSLSLSGIGSLLSLQRQPGATEKESFLLFARDYVKNGGYEWAVDYQRVPSRGDWFSEYWRRNNREVPKLWLTKRWVSPLAPSYKAVYEYREPFPAALEALAPVMLLGGEDPGGIIKAFSARADKAFMVRDRQGIFSDSWRAPKSLLPSVPSGVPHAERLLGNIVSSRQ